MTRERFRSILGPLVLALRAEFDQPNWTAYYRALQDVPDALLAAAVDRALRSPSPFMPKPGELRAAAEQERQALRAAQKYAGCLECEDQIGWRTVTHPDGAKVERCPCWKRHQQKLEELGVGGAPLSLPVGREAAYSDEGAQL